MQDKKNLLMEYKRWRKGDVTQKSKKTDISPKQTKGSLFFRVTQRNAPFSPLVSATFFLRVRYECRIKKQCIKADFLNKIFIFLKKSSVRKISFLLQTQAKW